MTDGKTTRSASKLADEGNASGGNCVLQAGFYMVPWWARMIFWLIDAKSRKCFDIVNINDNPLHRSYCSARLYLFVAGIDQILRIDDRAVDLYGPWWSTGLCYGLNGTINYVATATIIWWWNTFRNSWTRALTIHSHQSCARELLARLCPRSSWG